MIIDVVDATDVCLECSVNGKVCGQGETLDAHVTVLREHGVDGGAGASCRCALTSDTAHRPNCATTSLRNHSFMRPPSSDVEVAGYDKRHVAAAQRTEYGEA